MRNLILGAILVLITLGCLGSAIEDAPSTTQQKVNLEIGKMVFENNCRLCHGANGMGNPQIGSADLTSPAVKDLPRGIKRDQVINGGVNMPAFGQILSESEVEAVLDYIETL